MTPDMTRGCFCCHQNCSQSKHQLFTLYNLKSLLAVQLCHKLVTLHSPSSTCFAVNTLPFSSVFLIQIFFRQQGETREEVSQFKLTLGLSRKIKKIKHGAEEFIGENTNILFDAAWSERLQDSGLIWPETPQCLPKTVGLQCLLFISASTAFSLSKDMHVKVNDSKVSISDSANGLFIIGPVGIGNTWNDKQ